jgi:hypothetical protein
LGRVAQQPHLAPFLFLVLSRQLAAAEAVTITLSMVALADQAAAVRLILEMALEALQFPAKEILAAMHSTACRVNPQGAEVARGHLGATQQMLVVVAMAELELFLLLVAQEYSMLEVAAAEEGFSITVVMAALAAAAMLLVTPQ